MDQEFLKINHNNAFNLERELAKIPDQMAFKIGDVAELLGIKQYVLRYWEQEFKSLNPKKAVNNQRIYSRRDVETVILIKKFLYVDQFSIPGARKALKEFKEQQQLQKAKEQQQQSAEAAVLKASETSELQSAELLTEKYIKVEESITRLISKIKSARGKLEHKFHQIGI